MTAPIYHEGRPGYGEVKPKIITRANGSTYQTYEGCLKDARGKRRYVYDDRQKICMSKLREAERDAAAGKVSARDDVPFSVPLDEFLAHCDMRVGKKNLSPGTVHGYRGVAENHVRPALGHIKLNKIDTPTCQVLIHELQKKYKDLATTARKVIRGTLELAVDTGRLTANPLLLRKLKVIKNKPEIRFPTKAELRDLLEYTQDYGRHPFRVRRRLMVVLPLFCGGMRKGEQCALRWRHVDWAAGKIKIKDTICGVTGKPQGHPKTPASRRDVDIAPMVREPLMVAFELSGGDPDSFVLANDVGNHAYGLYHSWFAELMTRAGVVDADGKPSFTPHALRHACVSLLAEKRVPMLEVARLIGQKGIELAVGIYAHLFKDATDTATPALTAAYAELMPPPKMPQICDNTAPEAEDLEFV